MKMEAILNLDHPKFKEIEKTLKNLNGGQNTGEYLRKIKMHNKIKLSRSIKRNTGKVDASHIGLGAYPKQKWGEVVWIPISLVSR